MTTTRASQLRFQADERVRAALKLRAKLERMEYSYALTELYLSTIIKDMTPEQLLAYAERTQA